MNDQIADTERCQSRAPAGIIAQCTKLEGHTGKHESEGATWNLGLDQVLTPEQRALLIDGEVSA